MKFEQARDLIRERIDCKTMLQPSKNRLFCCPFCGSGTGPHATGALKVNKDGTFHCFACSKTGDVIDLYQNENGASFADAVRDLAQQAGITEPVEFGQGTGKKLTTTQRPATKSATPARDSVNHSFMASTSAADPEQPAPAEQNIDTLPAPMASAPAADYTAYYARCQNALAESPEAQAYLEKRGIDWLTALSHGVGYDPAADPARAPGGTGAAVHPCPRIIIPTSPAHYVGRSIDPTTDKAYLKLNNAGGRPGIFCADELYTGYDEIFVCEGAIDALSVWEAGKAAIGLNSAENARILLSLLEQRPTTSILILCLDNDKAGNKALQTLRDGLPRLNVSFVEANIAGAYKDPNDALCADREQFEEAIEQACMKTAARPDNTSLYLDRIMAGEITAFRNSGSVPTGFQNLDSKAKKAYPGLYVLAAISSLGKTTLALQMADNFASYGAHVLYFSLEQSRLEMVTKSLARYTALQAETPQQAVTALSIREGEADPAIVAGAVKQYKADNADRLSIIEGNFNCDIGYIRQYALEYRRRNNVTPIIFVDYLQILQPSAEGKSRASKKDEIDLAVTELKRLSREMNATIIVISSVNRANYLTPFSFESLKESGGIEYTSDVIWGLQLGCLDDDVFSQENKNIILKRQAIDAAKEENPRRIKLVCLKNRFGISHYETGFRYYPNCELFVPDDLQLQQPKGLKDNQRPRVRK